MGRGFKPPSFPERSTFGGWFGTLTFRKQDNNQQFSPQNGNRGKRAPPDHGHGRGHSKPKATAQNAPRPAATDKPIAQAKGKTNEGQGQPKRSRGQWPSAPRNPSARADTRHNRHTGYTPKPRRAPRDDARPCRSGPQYCREPNPPPIQIEDGIPRCQPRSHDQVREAKARWLPRLSPHTGLTLILEGIPPCPPGTL